MERSNGQRQLLDTPRGHRAAPRSSDR